MLHKYIKHPNAASTCDVLAGGGVVDAQRVLVEELLEISREGKARLNGAVGHNLLFWRRGGMKSEVVAWQIEKESNASSYWLRLNVCTTN